MVLAASCGGAKESDEPRHDSTWTVKAADGSGSVPLHTYNTGTMYELTVPDGTEVKIITKHGNAYAGNIRYEVEYEGGKYYVVDANIDNETAASKAERAASRRKSSMRWPIQILKTLAFAGLLILSFKRNKARSLKYYNEYYNRKGREFPWLDNWLKQNSGIPLDRATGDSGAATVLTIVIFIASYFLAAIFIRSNAAGEIFMTALPVAACEVIGFIMIRKKDQSAIQSTSGIMLECPSCHCPHSWTMLFSQNIVESQSTTETTTTTTQTDQYGSKSSKEEKSYRTVYAGRVIKDFKCENCGQTEHMDYTDAWGAPPDVKAHHYNPPARYMHG